MSRIAVWAALAALAFAAAAFSGCDLPGMGDDETALTTTTGATGPSGSGKKGSKDGPPGSGGAQPPQGAYDPEQDVEGNDIPPPPGSPAEKFEKACAENPGICD